MYYFGVWLLPLTLFFWESSMLHVSVLFHCRVAHHWVNMPQFVFRSFVDGYLGYMQIWPLWIKLLWTFLHVFCVKYMFSFFLDKYLRIELLSHRESDLTLWEFASFPKWLHRFTLPSVMCRHSSYFVSSPKFGVFSLFSFCYFREYEILFHCGVNLHFPKD